MCVEKVLTHIHTELITQSKKQSSLLLSDAENTMIYQSSTLFLQERTKHIVELCFSSSSSVNKLDLETLQHLDKALDKLYQYQGLAGLILTTNKSTFIVGADITQFLTLFTRPTSELTYWLKYANHIFNRLEDLPVPTVSALTGHVLGGGCECVLATDFRIASTTTSIGLPETKLGIIPGFGGTVRLPRLIGADSAMEAITKGKAYTAEQALKLGIIDAIVEQDILVNSALDTLQSAIQGKLDWKTRRTNKTQPLKLPQAEQKLCFQVAKSIIKNLSGKHYPAPLAAVNTISEAAMMKREQALDVERKHFIELAQSQQAHALIGLFLNDQQLKSSAKQAVQLTLSSFSSVGVIGAGIMGGGIAYQAAAKNMAVVVKDIQQTALDLGLSEAANLLSKQLEKGKIDTQEQAQVLNRITPTLHYAELESVPIVIEAVIENPKVKGSVLAEIEQVVSENTIIASNTSTIPINVLAQSLTKPERFCGMHFFNPVHRMPLVEIIRGKKTSEETIAQVVFLSLKMGKSPVVVNDCPGFFVNRVLFPYLTAFRLLVQDGADFSRIDQVMEQQFGWPMGPAYLLDVVGLDTAHHAQQVMDNSYPERATKVTKDIVTELYNLGLYGQKSRSGFYDYSKQQQKTKSASEQVLTLVKEINSSPVLNDSNEELIDRMMIPMINEVLLCLEQGIVSSAAEADMALVYGLGFPAFRGGVCRYLDQLGMQTYFDKLEKYKHLGPIYQAPPLLITMINNHNTFYSSQYQSRLPKTSVNSCHKGAES